jgi:endonuclease/exonuclease/phosphatase family metal-dependent hydrolase
MRRFKSPGAHCLPALFLHAAFFLSRLTELGAAPVLPPAVDGDLREWDAPAGSSIGVVTCADRIYLRLSLSGPAVLQDASGVVIYYDTDDDASTGLPVHGLGAEIRWDAGRRSGTSYASGPDGLTSWPIRHADLGLRAAPVLDSADFELSIQRTVAGAGACRIAVERHDEFLGGAVAAYRETRVVRSLPAARAPHTDLRVLAYNVLNDDLLDWPDKKEAFLAEFAALQPDILCLSEIYNHDAEAARVRVVEALPYMAYASGEGRTDSRRLRDNRIVSRFPILFSETNDRFHAARVRDDTGHIDVMVITAHLTCCSYSSTRADEMRQIQNFIVRLRAGALNGVPASLPLVLAGDLNLVRWDTEAFLGLQQATGLRPLPALHLDSLHDHTWRNDIESFSPGRLDYILAGPGLIARRSFVYKSSVPPSDHLPLVADLALDADGNGLGDLWEQHYSGSTGQLPWADPDGDGFTNADEQRLGTHPRRAADRPQLVAEAASEQLRVRMTGHGQASATFRLWHSSDLATWEAVPGRWRPDDASLLVQPVKEAAFFRATLDPE